MAAETVAPSADQHASQSVYEQIRSRVLREEIPPNARINIDALARELQVSSTPIREALRQLQGDNLVVQEPGRGYRTTPILNPTQLRELFEFRLLVEPWAAKIAAQDRLQNPAYRLEAEIADITALVSNQSDIRYELMDHDIRFHDAILGSTSNEVLRSAYAQTHCHLHAFRLHPGERTGEFTVQEHRVIHRAIRDHDPEAAEQAMRDHLAAAYLRFEVAHNISRGTPVLPGVHPDRPAAGNALSL
ncbi:GntR family transcriptional regulator [Leucobacter albus]|uniref:GntR family transcriptional regulator n=1 Tax=Leucobacter albus TaxID=272210 RepID=A0ABW3TSR4_9MICO